MSGCVLITGATGFVGSHIAEAFVAAGYTVRCSLRSTSDARWISNLPVERTLLDLDYPADLSKALEDVEIVVHVAGVTSARRPEDYYRVNADRTRRLAEAARGVGVGRFVYISSLAARGPDGHDHPASAYGKSKLEAEKLLRDLDGPMQIVVLRPAAVYGPRDTDLLPLFKMANRGWLTLPAGPGSLQPVYASDVAKAVLAAARGATSFGPFPTAERSSYSWRDVAEKLEEALGRSVRVVRLPTAGFRLAGRASELAAKPFGSVPAFDERRAEDLTVHTWTCDPSTTEKELEWRAEVPLPEGLRRTAQWYRSEGWL